MSEAPMVDAAAVGAVVEGRPYAVSGEEIAAYARATEDRTPACLAGRIAPPVYALNPVLATMVEAKKKAAPGFGFHGEHDIRMHRPIVAGMRIAPVAEVVGVHRRSSGATVTVRIDSYADGDLVNEQHFVSFVPGGRAAEDRGRAAPPHDVGAADTDGEPLFADDCPLAPDQTRRYADAANDHDAYTLDLEAARRMGFPALVVHGTLTWAIASRAIVAGPCGGDPARLARLAVRLSRPVFLTQGETIATRVWPAGAGRFAYIARNRAGEAVLTNGLAEVRS